MAESRVVVPFAVVLCLTGAGIAQSGVPWTAAVAEAQTRSKAENRVLVVALDLPGERSADELVADRFANAAVAKLAARTVNLFGSPGTETRVPGVSVVQQQAVEREARLAVLKVGPGEDLLLPQVVFVGPDGAVLEAVAGHVTAGELEWTWADALRRLDPKSEWTPSPAARAPLALKLGAVEKGKSTPPPTAEKVAEALKELKKARGDFWRSLSLADTLMRSTEPEGIAYLETSLRTLPAGAVAGALENLGRVSPKGWYTVAAGRLGERDDDLRAAAAGALEKLCEPKALAALSKQYKVEKVDRVRGRLLRAMAACAPTGKEVTAALDKVFAKEPSADVRAHAVLALALVEDRAKVQAGLAAALRDGSAKVRAAAAYSLGWRRDTECALKLGEATAMEGEADTKGWMEAAGQVVRGGDGALLKGFLSKVLGEDPVRQGLQRLGGGAGPGGGGSGGGPGGGAPGGGPGGGKKGG